MSKALTLHHFNRKYQLTGGSNCVYSIYSICENETIFSYHFPGELCMHFARSHAIVKHMYLIFMNQNDYKEFQSRCPKALKKCSNFSANAFNM